MCQDKSGSKRQLGGDGELLQGHKIWIRDMTQEGLAGIPV